ncbi:hypothetical protein RHMOL_Rhmol05G0099300 [Rhododendron molle]|uniref:Uncharacterized protein n=1 Tax=Rhododendron molle TaxID=49168 RepID=A0ACC0NNB8_RHOML|nr:hypothetical protein RHMOL_Rhmol05G0099300 [Rhododendron molle]
MVELSEFESFPSPKVYMVVKRQPFTLVVDGTEREDRSRVATRRKQRRRRVVAAVVEDMEFEAETKEQRPQRQRMRVEWRGGKASFN